MTFLRAIDRALARFYGWCGYAAAGFLVLLALLVLASIVTRLLDVYVAGLGAYSGYAMAGASFLAFAYTFRENGHIRVALVLGNAPRPLRRLLQVWCFAAGSTLSTYLAWYLVKMAHVSWQLGEVSEGADATPLWIPQSIAAFGAAVLAVCVAHNFVKFLVTRDETAVAGAAPASFEP